MPNYDYKCPICNEVKEVFHSIDELKNPSDKTLKEIMCEKDYTLMKRVFNAISGGYKRMSGMESEQRKQIM